MIADGKYVCDRFQVIDRATGKDVSEDKVIIDLNDLGATTPAMIYANNLIGTDKRPLGKQILERLATLFANGRGAG